MVHVGPHRNAVPLAVTHEAWLVVCGLLLSVLFVKTDVIAQVAAYSQDFATVASFIVGTFFTSVLTTTPAIVAIAELGKFIPAWQLALAGGAGAVCGDLLIFRFVRSPLAEYIVRTESNPWMRRVGRALARSPFWWIVPAFGAAIIASPLPDELGLIMMGLSHIRTGTFIVLAYVMNATGIFLIASAGQMFL